MRLRAVHPWAAASCLVYFVVAISSGGRLPFASFPMFTFPSAQGATAVPLFTVDGVRDDVSGYDAFFDIDPDAVDLTHEGYFCSVEHMFHEERAWIASHPGSGPSTGARPCAIGMTIVSLDDRGTVTIHDRIDATGRCRPR